MNIIVKGIVPVKMLDFDFNEMDFGFLHIVNKKLVSASLF